MQEGNSYFGDQFALRDDKGKVRARFLIEGNGQPALQFFDDADDPAQRICPLELRIQKDGTPNIYLADKSGPRLLIQLSKDGVPTLKFWSAEQDSLTLSVEPDDVTKVLLKDDSNRVRLRLEISELTKAGDMAETRLALLDTDGDSDFDTISQQR